MKTQYQMVSFKNAQSLGYNCRIVDNDGLILEERIMFDKPTFDGRELDYSEWKDRQEWSSPL